MRTLINKFYTKSAFAAIALFLLVAGKSIAQQSSNGSVQLNVNISNVIQLTVNTNVTNINFATLADYTNGKTVDVAAQINVASNLGYKLEVKALSANLSNASSYTIPVSNINVAITGTSDGGTQSAVNLSTANQTLTTGASATTSRNYTMRYTTSAGNNAFFVPSGTYSTTLTYTATQL